MMAIFCHNHCHYTCKLSNAKKKSLQMYTSTKGRVRNSYKTHSPFTIFNPTDYCFLLLTQMCDTHHFTAQHFACEVNRHTTVMWQHCFLPDEQTAPHRLTPLKSRWIVKVPPLLRAVVHLMLGGLRNDVYEDDDRAR